MAPLVSKKVECHCELHPEPVYVAERTRRRHQQIVRQRIRQRNIRTVNSSHLTTTNGPPNGFHSMELYDEDDIDNTVDDYFYLGDGNDAIEGENLCIPFVGFLTCSCIVRIEIPR